MGFLKVLRGLIFSHYSMQIAAPEVEPRGQLSL